MALVEDGALLGPRQLDMGNSGLGMITFKLPDVEGAGYAVCLPCYIKESS